MKNIEFYIFENELWYRTASGDNVQLTAEERDAVRSLIEKIKTFHGKAFKKLQERYRKCQSNIPHYQYMIVQRFCKCNFGNIDNIYDINTSGRFNLERISCPMRGECDMEDIVCNPEFDSNISASEMRVLELLFSGHKYNEIAEKLFLSEHTCRNHVRNAFTRLGFHEKAEFVDYAHRNRLFKEG